MRLGRYVKSPDEVKRYSIEYSDWLDTGEYLQAVTLDVTPVSTTSPLYAVASSIPASSTKFAFMVSGGEDNVNYEVVAKVTTTGGQIKEDTVLYTVRAPQ